MPQMNPILWLPLMIMFIIMFISVNSINYFFHYNYLIKYQNLNKKKNTLNWKW
uniref:ATP synthase complex subunit 8 n=1 Tax=Fuelleborniella sp. FuspCA TaxID=2597024 RepID=A0A8K1ZFF9_9NEOP|nr:ATP synthase F0 subunit 8 [Fuelleborniella sp. FuspCA]